MAANLSNVVAKVVSAKVLQKLRSNIVIPQLIRRDFSTEVAQFGNTVRVPTTGSVGVGLKSRGSDLSPSEPTDVDTQIVMDQHGVAHFKVEDISRALNRPNDILVYTEDAGVTLADQIDGYVLNVIRDGASTMIGGGGTTDVSVANLIALARILDQNKAPLRDRSAIWDPLAKEKMLQKAIFTGTNEASATAIGASLPPDAVRGPLMDAVLGRRFGITHYMDQNLSTYNSSANTQSNVAFSKEAAALVTRMVAPPIEGAGAVSEMITEAGMGLRTTISYTGVGMAHIVVIDLLYGADMLRAALAVLFTTNIS